MTNIPAAKPAANKSTASPARSASPARTFRLRAFQTDDLARAAMHDGVLLGWDPGLFKTGAAFIWPQLKNAKRVLIVAPEQLHEQIVNDEGVAKFGIRPRPLMNHEQFESDLVLKEAQRQFTESGMVSDQLTGWWITSYSALGFNGGDMWAPYYKENGELVVNSNIIDRRESHPLYVKEHDRGIGVTIHEIRCCFYPSLAQLTANLFDCVVCDEAVRLKSDETYCSLGVRMMQPQFRLVMSATPIKNRLDDIFWLAHWACGGHAEPTARWPYANSNEARAAFANEHMLIEQNHTREEKAVQRTGTYRVIKKRTPKICNIHRLWKLLGPVVLRRRKDDTGEDIVPKVIIPIRVKPGTAQQVVYQFHVENKPQVAKNGTAMAKIAAVVSQLQNLRQAALCPDTSNLSATGLSMHALREFIRKAKPSPPAGVNAIEFQRQTHRAALVAHKGERTPFQGEKEVAFAIVERMATEGKIDVQKIIEAAPSLAEKLKPFVVAADAAKHSRSWTDHNPKQAAVLKIIEEEISKGEQVVVMSPFTHFSSCLYRRLLEANVSCCCLDGRQSPAARGRTARQFKNKRYAVLIGGIHSMGEGNSFECASVLILPSLDWAYDKNRQAVDRVHRLISEKAVKIYLMVTENTIDVRLENVYREKGDSSNLALDGRLFADKTDEINLGKLLAEAIRDFNPNADTIPEKDIETEWESTMRQKLRHAEARFREFWPPIAAPKYGANVSVKDIAAALSAAKDSPTVSIIRCIPAATIGALTGTTDRTYIENVRDRFIAYVDANNIADWRMAWRQFESTGALERGDPTPNRNPNHDRNRAAEDFFENL